MGRQRSSRKPNGKQAVDYILQNVEDGHFSPHVAKTYPLSEVVTAYQDLQSNRQVGRIVLQP
ncbi:zinc-binding dehydrogenase [uncultured Limosilactobacillus sp.]|uniref:zinc-binding dehydrogenase n=1 Tax=uncultured Limosilactobacillus sp. TaxID=2837629 RepID=UPI0026010AEC|nr:zinc-binding dehydrogenase [uncultured Limosilactobacillus sp.]